MAEKHGISGDGVVWHFQPVGMISNFSKSGKIKIIVAMLKKVFEIFEKSDYVRTR